MKGQGLPLSTIVIGALALLVLVMVAGFFVPGVGKMFKQMIGISGAGGTPAAQFAKQCTQYCNSLKSQTAAASSADEVSSTIEHSKYCTSNGPSKPILNEKCYAGQSGNNVTVNCTIAGTDIADGSYC